MSKLADLLIEAIEDGREEAFRQMLKCPDPKEEQDEDHE